MKQTVFAMLGLTLVLTAQAQLNLDTLYVLDLHYESLDHGPKFYLESGNEIAFYYEGAIGARDIYFMASTPADDFAKEKISLKDSATQFWVSSFNVTKDGCYSLMYRPVGPLGYSAGSLALLNPSGQKFKTCKQLADGRQIVPGGETWLTLEEVSGLKRHNHHVKVKKEITSNGIEYAEARLNVSSGQKVIVSMLEQATSTRINFAIYKRENSGNTTVMEDFQYEIKDFGFQSLDGGEYVIQFWGAGVFKRVGDLKVEFAR